MPNEIQLARGAVRRGVGVCVMGALLVAIGLGSAGCGDRSAPPDEVAVHEGLALDLEVVAENLVTPWGLGIAPDGRIFVTEREGRVRVVDSSGLRAEPWAVVDVVSPDSRTEGGLLGLAVDPDFERTGHVFVVGTFALDDGFTNRVLRYTDRDGRGVEPTVLIDDLPVVRAEPGSEPAIHTHLGGALSFGPDGLLYVTTGDATRPALAQDPTSLAGKLLRYRPDGTLPDDNPTPGSPVYALGLRNPQGLAWHPETGGAFVSDHGPSELSWETEYGGWFGDELNAIVPGGNYGWPRVVGMGPLGRFLDPLVEWSPSIAPAGMTIYSGSRLPWGGDAIVASLRGQRLWRVLLERNDTLPSGWKAVRQEPWLENVVGRIRIVTLGPDGELYIATSNRDGRGKPRPGDDRIYRVVPGDAESVSD